jgi:hypothetical protein
MLERQSVQEEYQYVFTIDVDCFRGHVSMQPNSSTDPLPCRRPSAPDRRGMLLADSVPFHNVKLVYKIANGVVQVTRKVYILMSKPEQLETVSHMIRAT